MKRLFRRVLPGFSLSGSSLAFFALPAFVAMNVFAAADPALSPLPRFPLSSSPIRIVRNIEATKPFSVPGEWGAILGEQGGGGESGGFEAWVWPVKVISGLHVVAELADYPVPIDVNAQPGIIEVNPGHTTITYSHAAFTVREHIFSVRGDNPVRGTGPVILFEFSSVRPVDFTLQFTPVVERMWPAPNFGRPNAEWVAQGDSGFYILHTDNDQFSAAVAMPRAHSGILAPYQERPKFHPVELRLHFDPSRDSGLFFPLLMTTGAGTGSLAAQLHQLNDAIPDLYRATESHYDTLLRSSLHVSSPDPRFDQALEWAVVSIDQSQVRYKDEIGLTAGYYSSADSARPGFGWFFGRDTLWTLYAIHAYGDAATSRNAIEFLLRRQRADGKIMHEFSQSAEFVDWNALPYLYAEADATPLLLMVLEDYLATTGDLDFLRRHWEEAKKAYAFIRAHDSDGDGIYENTEGTGWVESWPSGMPHQEIYLAALDQQGTEAFSRLAHVMNEDDLAKRAADHAALIRSKIASEYFDQATRFYAFSRNPDGSLDKTATIYPAVAWWTGRLALPDSGAMLSRWAAPEFSTDWGTRDVSGDEKIFDPISYHQGTVWPLFTGWTSLAEFRAGRPLSATAHLMQNLGLTWQQDLGAVTELLSGAYFQPMGRSSSHQLWSSAMVFTPAIRGLLGLDFDALHHTLRLSPHLPASWSGVRIHEVPLGEMKLDLDMEREGNDLVVHAIARASAVFCLALAAEPRDADCHASPATDQTLHIPLPPVEVELSNELPEPGSATMRLKAIDEERAEHSYKLTLAGQGGSVHALRIRLNGVKRVRVSGATMAADRLSVTIPEGPGYQRQVVKMEW